MQRFQEEALDRYESLRNRFEGRLAEAHTSENKAHATIMILQRSLRVQQRSITLLRKTIKEGGSAEGNGRKRRTGTDLEGAREKKKAGGGDERKAVRGEKGTVQMTLRDGVPKPAKFRGGEKAVSLRQGVPEAAKVAPGAVDLRAGVPGAKKRRREETALERKIDIDLVSTDEDEPKQNVGEEERERSKRGAVKKQKKDGDVTTGQVADEHVPYKMPRYPVGLPRGDSNIGFFKYGRVWRTYWKRGPTESRAY